MRSVIVICALLLVGCDKCDNPDNKCKKFDYIEEHLDESIADDTIPYALYELYEKELYREHNITEN